LLLPVMPESRFSVFNLSRAKVAPPPTQVEAEQDVIPIVVIGPRTAQPQAVKAAVAQAITSNPINWRVWIFAAWIAGIFTLALRVAQVCWELSLTIRSLSVVS